jgi:hypothetical protein
VGVIDSSRRAGAPSFATAARLLGRVETRLILSAAIIVSLLPFGWVTRLDAGFFLLFSLEFVLRALLIFRGEELYTHGNQRGAAPSNADLEPLRGWQWPSHATLLLLVLDLLALLSFVPGMLGVDASETRWLRVFRLSRMLLLLSYWAPLVRDVWSVMRRQERAQQVVLMGFVVLALSFAGAVVIDQLHHDGDLPVDYDGDQIVGVDEQGEALDPDDTHFLVHLWWAFRQIQDPGDKGEDAANQQPANNRLRDQGAHDPSWCNPLGKLPGPVTPAADPGCVKGTLGQRLSHAGTGQTAFCGEISAGQTETNSPFCT